MSPQSTTHRFGRNGEKTLSVSSDNIVTVEQERRTTAATTRVATSTTVATLASSDENRRQLIIHNESGTTALLIKLGTSATTTDFSYSLGRGGNWVYDGPYTGDVTAIMSSGSSNAQVTTVT